MKDLIERLEKATGPDREVDCLIAVVAGWDVKYRMMPLATLVEKLGLEWLVEAATSGQSTYDALPAYTSSIDAALTLVPEGWTWDVDATAPECGVDWTLYEPIADGKRVMGTHNCPAIALCIAALKARNESEKP